ncbi:MAG: hypothetical protein LAT75_01995 [Candidatus Cyclonatronum sp.]|uniref:hypothetical protein n=1 Tax=Cyclonatronum sp. TaxID=3024185 RepID=UPI0025C6C35B|nr:hypothetical protein [Cyclonatronum sp.]MCC5932815.1 hypothetical protein [Balneolales bacterium]MCH8485605.1 hypothetical protein [Cyclonatronum sp.]
MSETSSKNIITIIYSLLLVLALFMHMSISGVEVGGLIIGIFTEPTGIITFISTIFSWLIKFIFRAHTIYMAGTTLILWFVVLPMLVRYRVIQVRVTFLLSLSVTLFLFLFLKMYGFVAL